MAWKPPQDKVVTAKWKPPVDQVVSDNTPQEPRDDRGLIRRGAENLINSPALPIAGSVAGGIAGGLASAPFGGAGAIPIAGIGAAGGEALRQLGARALGMKAPQTPSEAANKIGVEGALGMMGEGIGKGIGFVGSKTLKALPRIAESFSGSPSRNFAKALKRGHETYLPKGAVKLTREQAGKALGEQEQSLLSLFYSPKEKVAIDLNKSGFANNLIEKVALKIERGEAITPKEAIGVRRAIATAFPADTAKSAGLRARLSGINAAAREVISRDLPGLSKALKNSESTILRNQLSKPFRVNRTNPDQYSGLAGTILPIAGGIAGYKTDSMAPVAGGMLATSPLAFGLGAAALGTARNITNPLIRRAIQRTAAQALSRAFREDK